MHLQEQITIWMNSLPEFLHLLIGFGTNYIQFSMFFNSISHLCLQLFYPMPTLTLTYITSSCNTLSSPRADIFIFADLYGELFRQIHILKKIPQALLSSLFMHDINFSQSGLSLISWQWILTYRKGAAWYGVLLVLWKYLYWLDIFQKRQNLESRGTERSYCALFLFILSYITHSAPLFDIYSCNEILLFCPYNNSYSCNSA